MNRFTALLALSFLGSVASIFASRGVYFFTYREFAFSQWENLFLALASGVAYLVYCLAG